MPTPWAALPAIEGANIYRYLPTGAIAVPAIVYRPDSPWIEKRATYKTWLENYVAICLVAENAGGVDQLYAMALAVKAALEADPALRAWEWRGVGGTVETEQAGFKYLAAAVRLSFSDTGY